MEIPKKMRAAVLYGNNDIRVEERDVPTLRPDEALIKVESCGICGTDIKIISHGMPNQPPFGDFIIGHEYAGTVVALGETVDEFAIGDRIAVEIHKGCMRCKNCIMGDYTACLNYGNVAKGHRANGFTTNGGFAEYAANHVNTLSKIPDNISFDESTIITTATSESGPTADVASVPVNRLTECLEDFGQLVEQVHLVGLGEQQVFRQLRVRVEWRRVRIERLQL